MIRIMWKIEGRTGHGSCMPNNPLNHQSLQAHVHAMNAKYGAGTHWIVSQ